MENSKGQNHPDTDRANSNSFSDTDKSMTNRRTHGTVDMDPQESIASSGVTQRGSGINTKRNVTGSDYDGQLSGE